MANDKDINIVVKLIDEASKNLNKIESAAGSTVSRVNDLKGSLATLAAGAGLAGIGIKMANEAAEYANAVRDIKNLTGETAENASLLKAEFGYFGISSEQATGSIAKFQKNLAAARETMYKAQQEGKKSTDAFSKLGMSLDDITKNTTFEVLSKIQEKMRGMSDAAEKDRISMELFGKSGYQMMDFLNATPEQLQAISDKFEKLGLIMNDENLDAAIKYERQMNALKGTTSKLAIGIGTELIPVLTEQVEWLNSVGTEFSTLDKGTKSMIATVSTMGIEFGVINIAIGTVTSSLKAMGVATKLAAGPWVLLAEAITLAGVALYNFSKTKSEWKNNHTYEVDGKSYFVDEYGNVLKSEGGEKSDPAIDPMGLGSGISINATDIDEKTQKAVKEKYNAQIAQEKKDKEDEENRKRQEEIKKAQKETEEIIKRLQQSEGSANDAAKKQEKAAKLAAKAAQEQAQVIQENARLIQQANEKIDNIINGIKDDVLEQTGTKKQIADNRAREKYNQTNKNIMETGVRLKRYNPSAVSSGNGTESNIGNAVYQYAADRDGMPYLLGGDGLSATDCGKLFEDAFESATGKVMARYVPDIIQQAKEAGAWHPAGDGYIPAKGDGVVVLGNEHIVISNGQGGYVGANSSTGVIEKESVQGDFGAVTGYISTAQMVPGLIQAVQQNTESLQTAADIQQNMMAAIPQTDMVQIIENAANKLSFTDIPLAVAVAAKESGGGDINAINPYAYNPGSGATGMFQILDGQDVLGDDGQRHRIEDLYPDYKVDALQNALAGITMLVDKIRENGGDVHAGLAAYGEGNAYADDVMGIYQSLGGGGMNLLPMTNATYRSPRTGEALQANENRLTLELAKNESENNARKRKQLEEIKQLEDENAGDRLKAIQDERDANMQLYMEKEDEYYKDTESFEQAHRLRDAYMLKSQLEAEQKERSLRETEKEEYMDHLDNLVTLNGVADSAMDKSRKEILQNFIKYEQQQLEEAQLTAEQRIELENKVAEETKKLQEIESKSLRGGFDALMREVKNYNMQTGTDLISAWDSMNDSLTGVFDDMLTTNESFTDRMKNLYISLANEILNVMMKIIMQGLIMNVIMKAFGIGGSGFSMGYSSGISGDAGNWAYSSPSFNTGSHFYTSGILTGGAAFASGGDISDNGWHLVGENGPELLKLSNSRGHIYPADETRNRLSGTQQNLKNVKVEIINQSGQQLKVDDAKIDFDGQTYVISTLLSGIATNKMGIRDVLKGASK